MPSKKNPNLLFVEGKDDYHVILALAVAYNLPVGLFEPIDQEGFSNILNIFPREIRLNSILRNLGLVVDADTNLDQRWDELRSRLLNIGYSNVPLKPEPTGTIVEEVGKPRIGIWLMPDNKLPGMLEDFIAYLVPDPANDKLWQLSEKCLQEARAVTTTIPEAKGRIHTYLAWQDDPGVPLGLSITKKYLDPTKAHAQNFVVWINRLFS
jgi:hypothetical protein